MTATGLSHDEMKTLADTLNREFGRPFLPNDHVVASIEKTDDEERVLRLKVSTREIIFNNKMEMIQAGGAIGYPGVYHQFR